MSLNEKISNWSRFALMMRQVGEEFPEHAPEIERAVAQAAQKLESCGDPNCTCRMTAENFRDYSEPKSLSIKRQG